MSQYNFADNAQTTVALSKTAPAQGTTESWVVASSTGFPAASTSAGTQFTIVDMAAQSEIILVTNVSGTTWSVTRGVEGTTPVTHAAGFTVAHMLSSGALGQFLQNANNLSDVSAIATARDNLGTVKVVNAKKDFGAVGDNTTDDTTALQNFFTAIGQGGSKAGTLGYIPAGTYKITNAIAGASLTRCMGAGKYLTVIQQHANNKDILQFNGSSGANMLGVELSDFSLTGPYRVDSTGTSTTNGSTTVNDTHAIADDAGLSISGPGIPASTTISSVTPGTSYVISNAATATATNPKLTIGGTSTGVGLNLNFWLDTCSLKRMIIQNNGSHGVKLQNSYLISFEHVWHYNNGGDGLNATTSINSVKWDNCEFFGNLNNGATISGTAGATIISSDFESNGQHGLSLDNCYAMLITGNDFENNGTTTANTYDALKVDHTQGYAGPRIVANNFTGTSNQTANGIELTANVTSAYIDSNAFNNFGSQDILINTSASGVVLGPSNIHQAGSEVLVTDNGTGTNYLGTSDNYWNAADAGWKAASFDFFNTPNMSAGGGMVNYAQGVIFGTLVKVRKPVSVSKLQFYWTQPTGGSPANCFAGIVNSSGTLVGKTADLTSTATGLLSQTLTGGPFLLPAGNYYAVLLIGTQGTTPGGINYPTATLISGLGVGQSYGGLSASGYRCVKIGNLTGQTSLAGPYTLSNNVAALPLFGVAFL